MLAAGVVVTVLNMRLLLTITALGFQGALAFTVDRRPRAVAAFRHIHPPPQHETTSAAVPTTRTRNTPPFSAISSSTREDLETLTVNPIQSLDGTVTLPGSKSLSNRCLLLAALSQGNTRVDNLLESDDIRYMLQALDTLQVPVERHSAESVTVTGQAGPIDSPYSSDDDDDDDTAVCELFLGNAGTAMRPLAAALCMGRGRFVLDGVPRMRERPIADLVDGLRQLGANVQCVEETGCPPVTIHAEGGLKGAVVVVATIIGLRLAGKCRRSSCRPFSWRRPWWTET